MRCSRDVAWLLLACALVQVSVMAWLPSPDLFATPSPPVVPHGLAQRPAALAGPPPLHAAFLAPPNATRTRCATLAHLPPSAYAPCERAALLPSDVLLRAARWWLRMDASPGLLLRARAAAAGTALAAVVVTRAHPHAARALATRLAHLGLFGTVVVWNDNTGLELTPECLELPEPYAGATRLAVHNSREGMGELARYAACSASGADACFAQDDLWDVGSTVYSLVAAFLREPTRPHCLAAPTETRAGGCEAGLGSVFAREHAEELLVLARQSLTPAELLHADSALGALGAHAVPMSHVTFLRRWGNDNASLPPDPARGPPAPHDLSAEASAAKSAAKYAKKIGVALSVEAPQFQQAARSVCSFSYMCALLSNAGPSPLDIAAQTLTPVEREWLAVHSPAAAFDMRVQTAWIPPLPCALGAVLIANLSGAEAEAYAARTADACGVGEGHFYGADFLRARAAGSRVSVVFAHSMGLQLSLDVQLSVDGIEWRGPAANGTLGRSCGAVGALANDPRGTGRFWCTYEVNEEFEAMRFVSPKQQRELFVVSEFPALLGTVLRRRI
eukprot:m51a1_g1296 hypothetical protein (561) ;mRNA; r:185888-187570